jgi:hypothetical protein
LTQKRFISQKKKKILSKIQPYKVSVSKDCKPFSFQNKDGSPAGISAEYWDIVIKALDLKVEYQYEDIFTKQLHEY